MGVMDERRTHRTGSRGGEHCGKTSTSNHCGKRDGQRGWTEGGTSRDSVSVLEPLSATTEDTGLPDSPGDPGGTRSPHPRVVFFVEYVIPLSFIS